MNTETRMTIHRALAELKLIDARTEKQINELEPLAIVQKGKKINDRYTVEEFTSAATSKYQSITDLIARKQKIKSAIVKSNSTTEVTVGDKTMTVADAITFRSNLATKKLLIARLSRQGITMQAGLNKNNEVINQNAKNLVEVALGKDSVKVDGTEAAAITDPYLAKNIFEMVDPLKVVEKLDELNKDVEGFETDIDAALSESNATTFIDIA